MEYPPFGCVFGRRMLVIRRPGLKGVVVIAGIGLAAVLLFAILWQSDGTKSVSADTLARGKEIYADNCAGCHGGKLEGQPNWKERLATGRLPAPPHDASGHTWHHSDEVLLQITKEGSAAVIAGGYESDMPGFGSVLSENQISAVLEFIKSSWPEREREYQAGLNRPNGTR